MVLGASKMIPEYEASGGSHGSGGGGEAGAVSNISFRVGHQM